jgi:hypothetical protein
MTGGVVRRALQWKRVSIGAVVYAALIIAWAAALGTGCLSESDPPGAHLVIQAGGCASGIALEIDNQIVLTGLRDRDCVELQRGPSQAWTAINAVCFDGGRRYSVPGVLDWTDGSSRCQRVVASLP